MYDRRHNLRSNEVSISFEAVQSILLNILGLSKVSARSMVRMLSDDQKGMCLIFLGISCDPGDFIERVVTQDETWVHHFDPESKMQSKQWKHPGSPP